MCYNMFTEYSKYRGGLILKVLITGASSGIGKEIARKAVKYYDEMVLVGRNEERLNELKNELESSYLVKVTAIASDLSIQQNCIDIFNANKDVHLLVNNAGFGDTGKFNETDLNKDTDMINTNILAMHTFMKLYLGEMKKHNRGHILNTASMAGFFPGPLMATYYASKAYVISLSQAVREELKREGSAVTISVLCPGPVSTNFGKSANVDFYFKDFATTGKYIADYVFKHFSNFYIIPKIEMKTAFILSRILPPSFSASVLYSIHNNKIKDKSLSEEIK